MFHHFITSVQVPISIMNTLHLYLMVSILNGHHTITYGLFEDIREMMSNSISYLNQGLDVIKRIEEFVDNSIGEECIFECSKKGYIAKPKSNYVPSTNGCGSLDFLFDDSEESLIHVEKEFSQCCDDHDYCYDSCGTDKDECDLIFKKCLYSKCKSKQHKFFDAKKCRLKAKLFYVTVIGVGCQSFIDAQRNSCDCIRPSTSEL